MSDASALWHFVVEAYARPGVRPACLALQDDADLDVCVLLACVWLGQRGVPVDDSAEAIERALAATRALRLDVLAPLRASRRALKPLLASLPVQAQDVRARLAAEEMALEELLCGLLSAHLAALPGAPVPTDARAHLAHYLRVEGRTLDAPAEAAFARVTRGAA